MVRVVIPLGWLGWVVPLGWLGLGMPVGWLAWYAIGVARVG